MFHYLCWILAAILYVPLFKRLYRPVLEGLTSGLGPFIDAFGKPWGDVADYTHAYFILPLSIWLIFRKRAELRHLYKSEQLRQGKNLLSLSFLVLSLLLFFFGQNQQYMFISTLSAIPFFLSLVGFLYGTKILKVAAFPILYLFFLVPPPSAVLDTITLPMRHGISFLTEIILHIFNYPITRDGLLLTIGYFDIFMGEPCSGFRSLINMLALVLVYVYISKSENRTKIILTSLIIPFALLGNLIRVITLCLITFYFGEEAGQGFFHNFSGIVIFIITILGVMGVESFMGYAKESR